MDKDERLVVSVPEAGRALGICRCTAYTLARRGVIPTLRLGKRMVVPKAALARLLAGATGPTGEGGAAPPPGRGNGV